jgi:hypothetical protein
MNGEDQMNKTLKWILISLGIVLGLLLIVAVVFHSFAGGYSRLGVSDDYMRPFSRMDRFEDYQHPFTTLRRVPMMTFMPMMVFGFFRGLVGLGILALAVIGVVLLVRNGKSKEAAPPVAVVPEGIMEPAKHCHHCSREINTDWVACPYCGKKQ